MHLNVYLLIISYILLAFLFKDMKQEQVQPVSKAYCVKKKTKKYLSQYSGNIRHECYTLVYFTYLNYSFPIQFPVKTSQHTHHVCTFYVCSILPIGLSGLKGGRVKVLVVEGCKQGFLSSGS